MKKTVFILACILFCAASFAQNRLDGKWVFLEKEKENVDEEDNKGNLDIRYSETFIFKAGKFERILTAKADADIDGKDDDGKELKVKFFLDLDARHSGRVTVDNNVLSFTPDKTNPEIELSSELKGVPGGRILKSVMTAKMKKEISAELKEAKQYRIVSLTESELVLEQIPGEKKEKEAESPLTRTYIRSEQ